MLNAVLIGAAVHFVTIPIWGALSDRFGRRPIYLFGAVGVGVWAFVFIACSTPKNFALTVLAVVGGLVFHGAMYGPQAAFLSELFGTKVRYSGVSVGYQLASIVAGGPGADHRGVRSTPRSTAATRSRCTSRCAVITMVAVATYSETRQRDLAEDNAVAVHRSGREQPTAERSRRRDPTPAVPGGGRIARVSETVLELLRLLAQDAPVERIEEAARRWPRPIPSTGPPPARSPCASGPGSTRAAAGRPSCPRWSTRPATSPRCPTPAACSTRSCAGPARCWPPTSPT